VHSNVSLVRLSNVNESTTYTLKQSVTANWVSGINHHSVMLAHTVVSLPRNETVNVQGFVLPKSKALLNYHGLGNIQTVGNIKTTTMLSYVGSANENTHYSVLSKVMLNYSPSETIQPRSNVTISSPVRIGYSSAASIDSYATFEHTVIIAADTYSNDIDTLRINPSFPSYQFINYTRE
jgi:hypothetical protein